MAATLTLGFHCPLPVALSLSLLPCLLLCIQEVADFVLCLLTITHLIQRFYCAVSLAETASVFSTGPNLQVHCPRLQISTLRTQQSVTMRSTMRSSHTRANFIGGEPHASEHVLHTTMPQGPLQQTRTPRSVSGNANADNSRGAKPPRLLGRVARGFQSPLNKFREALSERVYRSQRESNIGRSGLIAYFTCLPHDKLLRRKLTRLRYPLSLDMGLFRLGASPVIFLAEIAAKKRLKDRQENSEATRRECPWVE